MADIPNISSYRKDWLEQRHLCRTDLRFLCWTLGYRDVSTKVHGEIISVLQRFPGGVDSPRVLTGEKFTTRHLVEEFEAKVPNWYDLEGPRQVLILVPRGHLKSTIVTIAHNIQWLINYPNIRIRLHSATAKQVEGFYRELRSHFISGEKFRMLFPEFVPTGKKSGKVLQQIYGACMDICGYTKKDMEELTAPNPFSKTANSSSGSA